MNQRMIGIYLSMVASSTLLACGSNDDGATARVEAEATPAVHASQRLSASQKHARVRFARAAGTVGIFSSGLALADLSTPRSVDDQFCHTEVHDQNDGARCEFKTCDQTISSADVPSPVSAGDITVRGLLEPVTLTPNDNGTYPFYFASTSPLWSGGEHVTVRWPGAMGGVRPAAAALSAPPVGISLSAPLGPVISHTGDLVLGWTGVPSPTRSDYRFSVYVNSYLDITVDAYPSDFKPLLPAYSIHCDYPLRHGQGQVPGTLLARIPPGPNGEVFVITQVESSKRAGGALVTLAADVIGAPTDYLQFQ